MTGLIDLPDGVLNVSRETLERLHILESLVQKWNPKINLVSRNSLEEFWMRHIVDSIQVFRIAEADGKWVDLGSGGGFPGLVVAIMAACERPETHVTLIESDQRKCAFLRTAVREMGITCRVLAERIEQATPQQARILSARALTDLNGLLSYADRHLCAEGIALFPKGVTWKKEVDDARRSWRFEVETINSMTEAGSVILNITGASRV